MTNLTTVIKVNIDTEIKEKATKILENLGLNMNTAINMFLIQIVKRDGIPFEITNPKPNKEMYEALGEVEEMIKEREKYPRYNNRKDLEKALLSDD